LCFPLFSSPISTKTYESIQIDEITSIYDGNTFRVNIKGYPIIVGERMVIRTKGINTPELRGKCEKEKVLARKAKARTLKLLRDANVVEFRGLMRGKYFRIIADVFVDGDSVG